MNPIRVKLQIQMREVGRQERQEKGRDDPVTYSLQREA